MSHAVQRVLWAAYGCDLACLDTYSAGDARLCYAGDQTDQATCESITYSALCEDSGEVSPAAGGSTTAPSVRTVPDELMSAGAPGAVPRPLAEWNQALLRRAPPHASPPILTPHRRRLLAEAVLARAASLATLWIQALRRCPPIPQIRRHAARAQPPAQVAKVACQDRLAAPTLSQQAPQPPRRCSAALTACLALRSSS